MTCPTHSPARSRAPQAFTLARVTYDHPDVRRLVEALHAGQHALYGFADDPYDTSPDEFALPQGLFVIGTLEPEGIAAACGGWHRLDGLPSTAEIKRMYVHPDARGRGYGHRILQHLEQSAANAGITRMLLETGRDNTDALALYARCGYHPIPSYAPGRDPRINRALAKRLAC